MAMWKSMLEMAVKASGSVASHVTPPSVLLTKSSSGLLKTNQRFDESWPDRAIFQRGNPSEAP